MLTYDTPALRQTGNEHICSMCIKINKVGKQEVGIWRVQNRYPQYGIPIWCLWPNIRFLPSTFTEKNATKNILDGRKDRGKTIHPPEMRSDYCEPSIDSSCKILNQMTQSFWKDLKNYFSHFGFRNENRKPFFRIIHSYKSLKTCTLTYWLLNRTGKKFIRSSHKNQVKEKSLRIFILTTR